jgi:hypothetical protein
MVQSPWADSCPLTFVPEPVDVMSGDDSRDGRNTLEDFTNALAPFFPESSGPQIPDGFTGIENDGAHGISL